LYDKNRKEIYENDIIDMGDNYNSLVLWDNKEAKFALLEFYPKGDYNRYHDMGYLNYKPRVVGNVYDNKNLLKEGITNGNSFLKENG